MSTKIDGMIMTGKTEVLSQCSKVHHKFHENWPGIEPKVLARSNRLSHGTLN